jgi:hypothetical protein
MLCEQMHRPFQLLERLLDPLGPQAGDPLRQGTGNREFNGMHDAEAGGRCERRDPTIGGDETAAVRRGQPDPGAVGHDEGREHTADQRMPPEPLPLVGRVPPAPEHRLGAHAAREVEQRLQRLAGLLERLEAGMLLERRRRRLHGLAPLREHAGRPSPRFDHDPRRALLRRHHGWLLVAGRCREQPVESLRRPDARPAGEQTHRPIDRLDRVLLAPHRAGDLPHMGEGLPPLDQVRQPARAGLHRHERQRHRIDRLLGCPGLRDQLPAIDPPMEDRDAGSHLLEVFRRHDHAGGAEQPPDLPVVEAGGQPLVPACDGRGASGCPRRCGGGPFFRGRVGIVGYR